MGASRLVIAIPAFNEADTVADVVAEVRSAVPHATVLVVDDGSTDDTGRRAAAAGAQVLTLPFNCGVGGAMGAAFQYAAQADCDALVQVDADGQHDASHIPELLAGLELADVVVGARFAGVGDYQVRGPRRWSMVLLSRTVSAVVGARLTDTTSGFRASGPKAIALYAGNYPAQYLGDTVESLVLASRAGLKIAQVPVVMRERQGGQASHGFSRSALHVGRAYLALFAAVTRPTPKVGGA